MSIVSIDLRVPRRGSVATERKGMLTEVARRRYVKPFQVIVNDILDGPNTILKSYGVPKLGESYVLGNDVDTLATCVNVTCEPTEHPMVFHLTAEYDTSRVVDLNYDNPLAIPPEISWSFASYTRPLARDVLGVPAVNSAQDFFDPPYEVEDYRPVVVIVRNEAGFDPAIAQSYQNSCNSDVWNALSPYHAKLTSISGQRQADLGTRYWKNSYEIEFRRESFALPILDQGYGGFHLDDGGAKKRQFRDLNDNSSLANPTLLNGRGYKRDIARAKLTNAMTADINSLSTDANPLKFPPLASGGETLPPHGFFEVRIDKEILQVRACVGGFWAVARGWAGTVPAPHDTGADVILEPYFLRFAPFKAMPFSDLNLPLF